VPWVCHGSLMGALNLSMHSICASWHFECLSLYVCCKQIYWFFYLFQEARNLEDFLENFKNDPTVKIPRVYKQFSGPRVLVMEWIDGIRCTNPQVCLFGLGMIIQYVVSFWSSMVCCLVDNNSPVHQAIKEAGIDVDGFLTIGVSAALRQLLEFGLFHGDPHPGNIFAMRDGRIAYVDFGNVAVLSQVILHMASI